MNTFLYFPLGLSLSALVGPWAILAGFALSLGIECWQYFTGAGLAQVTDVVCNTIGCAIGAIPWFVNRWIDKRRGRRRGKDGQELATQIVDSSNQHTVPKPDDLYAALKPAGPSTAAKLDDPHAAAKPDDQSTAARPEGKD